MAGGFLGGPFLVEGNQAGEDVIFGETLRPAISGEHGRV
jgi:hypothetical protein